MANICKHLVQKCFQQLLAIFPSPVAGSKSSGRLTEIIPPEYRVNLTLLCRVVAKKLHGLSIRLNNSLSSKFRRTAFNKSSSVLCRLSYRFCTGCFGGSNSPHTPNPRKKVAFVFPPTTQMCEAPVEVAAIRKRLCRDI